MECSQSFRLSLAWVGGVEWIPQDGHTDSALQVASARHAITSAERKKVQDPTLTPGLQTFLIWNRPPRGPQPVPLCPLKQQLPKQSLMVLKCKPGRSPFLRR